MSFLSRFFGRKKRTEVVTTYRRPVSTNILISSNDSELLTPIDSSPSGGND